MLPGQHIKVGDEVTWTLKSDYQDEFIVLAIFPDAHHKDDAGIPIIMAKLKPLNPARFDAVMRPRDVTGVADPDDLTVYVPIAILLPIIRRTLH